MVSRLLVDTSDKVALEIGAWLYAVHRSCAETAAVSHYTNHDND